jgi:RNase P subunit RPR2
MSDFDHRECPVCNSTMRLMLMEPRRLTNTDGYERHVFHCDECANVSRFIFETPSRQIATYSNAFILP